MNGPPRRIVKREKAKMMDQIRQNLSSDLLLEKEYHFDETMGVSLDEHT